MTIRLAKIQYRSWWRTLLNKCRLPVTPTRDVEVDIPFVYSKDGNEATLDLPNHKTSFHVDLQSGLFASKSAGNVIAGYSIECSR